MALDDPTSKMSKSSPAGAISLLDDASTIKKKYARATTDSERTIVFNPERKGLYNLLTIYQLLAREDQATVAAHFEGKGYKELKAELTDLTVATLAPIQARYKEISADKNYLMSILTNGADQVRPIAQATLLRARKAMGFIL